MSGASGTGGSGSTVGWMSAGLPTLVARAAASGISSDGSESTSICAGASFSGAGGAAAWLSARLRSALPFLLFAASCRCRSRSSRSDFSFWDRELRVFFEPFLVVAPSSESSWGSDLVSDGGVADRELVRCLLTLAGFL